jgi:GMP synthase (glutamine-hydrolysing)
VQGGFAVLDFGSQLTQLIARRLRELGVYSQLLPFDTDINKIIEMRPDGIILSGGPSSVRDPGAPYRDIKELEKIAPILGICYGMQLISKDLGGEVESATSREYGHNTVNWSEFLADKKSLKQKVWMSHGDIVSCVPAGFQVVGLSEGGHIAAMRSERIWAVQFHPEVQHTENGIEILRSFVFDLCKAEANWKAPHIVGELISKLKAQVPGKEHVLLGLSGGVDSTVVAALLTKALGAERVHCVFVNNGLLRKNEYQEVLASYKAIGFNVIGADAEDEFLVALKGLSDPEKKRKAIGKTFIDVFVKSVEMLKSQNKVDDIKWLAQGTLYPDVIESLSPRGASATIKSHHNVGGLPASLKLKLVEPLRELFKDEVRAIGLELGLPREAIGRHPFPGPGLAIRVMGEVDREALEIVRNVDAVYISELKKHGLYEKIWQAFCVLLPVRTVGVQGDERTYDRVIALRAVTSTDGMTADWYPFEFNFLRELSNRITNEVKGVNRVVYDVTSKPPGTIEWE